MTESLYGIFGGTFDPVHNGHLNTVASVKANCNLQKVSFIPASIPPHRDLPGATAKQRLDMVELAISGYPDFEVDDRELQRDSPSYTFDTVKSLQADFPNRNYCFIVGVDAFIGLEKWHLWRDLLDQVNFIVMRRPGWLAPSPLPIWWSERKKHCCDELRNNNIARSGGGIVEIEVEPNPVSATEIRYGIASNVDISSMVTDSVRDYIYSNNLYHKE